MKAKTMQIGDEITWREAVSAKTARGKRFRFITGVIVGSRRRGEETEHEIAIRWLSGDLPYMVQPFVWIPKQALAVARQFGHRHVNKTSPFQLLRQRVNRRSQAKLDVILKNIAVGTESSNK